MKNRLEMILITINLSLFLLSCGNRYQNESIDSRLAPYLSEFKSQASKRGRWIDDSSLTMSFRDVLPQPQNSIGIEIGVCEYTSKGNNVIIKISYWNSVPNQDREQVVFHELGHCLLNLDHNNAVEYAYGYGNNIPSVQTVPSSIMNAYHFNSDLYVGNRENYLSRMFLNKYNERLYLNAPSQFDNNLYN